MKKLFFTAAMLLIVALGAIASKPTVFVEKFSNPNDYSDAWVQVVRNGVIEALQKSGRVNVVDAVTEETRMDEELRRLKENASQANLETSQALEVLGSNYILAGDINTINVTESVLESGTHSFDANVNMTLKVVNAVDGVNISTESYTFPKPGVMGLGGLVCGVTKGVMESADAAVSSLQGDVTKGLKKFVVASFPLVGRVEAVDQSKGNEAKTLYIDLGSQDGVAKGAKFEVRSEKALGSKKVMKKIGEVEVAEVDDEMSLCKVKQGGVEIMTAVQNDVPTIVRSIAK